MTAVGVPATYEDRYVAYLDIIGFKELIARSCGAEPAVTVEEIRSILDVPPPAEREKIVVGRIGDIAASDHRMTAFSDGVVITTGPTEPGLLHLLHHIEKIGLRAAELGTLYRGAVTRGPVYHDSRQAFGPALIEAIEMEKSAAKFPRVILSRAVVEAGRSAAEPVATIFGRLTQTDSDGAVYVHCLRILQVIAETDQGFSGRSAEIVAQIASFLEREETRLSATAPREELRGASPSPIEKIRWFRAYFARATDRGWVEALNAPYPADVLPRFDVRPACRPPGAPSAPVLG